MDTSPGSSRSLPITNSFSKMVGVVPAAPPPPARAHLPWSPARAHLPWARPVPASPPFRGCSPGPPYVCLKMLPQPHDVFTPSCLLLSQFDTWWEEEMGLRGAVANCSGGGKFRHNCSGPAAPAAWGAGAGTGRAASSWSTDATEQRLRVPLRPAPRRRLSGWPGKGRPGFQPPNPVSLLQPGSRRLGISDSNPVGNRGSLSAQPPNSGPGGARALMTVTPVGWGSGVKSRLLSRAAPARSQQVQF